MHYKPLTLSWISWISLIATVHQVQYTAVVIPGIPVFEYSYTRAPGIVYTTSRYT